MHDHFSRQHHPSATTHHVSYMTKLPKHNWHARALLFQEDYYTVWQKQQYKNIRVRLNADGASSLQNNPYKQLYPYLVTKLMPAAIDFVTNAIRVVPVHGMLRLGSTGGSCAGLAVPKTYRTVGVDADLVLFLSADMTTGELNV